MTAATRIAPLLQKKIGRCSIRQGAARLTRASFVRPTFRSCCINHYSTIDARGSILERQHVDNIRQRQQHALSGSRYQLNHFSSSKDASKDTKENSSQDDVETIRISVVDEQEISSDAGKSPTKGEEKDIDRSKFTVEIEVLMPDMGAGTSDGQYKILEWYKKEGDIVRHGDLLCDIETPDFTFGMETDDEQLGILGKICCPDTPSEPMKAGDVICVLLHEEKKKESTTKSTEDSSEGN